MPSLPGPAFRAQQRHGLGRRGGRAASRPSSWPAWATTATARRAATGARRSPAGRGHHPERWSGSTSTCSRGRGPGTRRASRRVPVEVGSGRMGTTAPAVGYKAMQATKRRRWPPRSPTRRRPARVDRREVPGWTDEPVGPEAVLTEVSIYWLTGTAGSSLRMYLETYARAGARRAIRFGFGRRDGVPARAHPPIRQWGAGGPTSPGGPRCPPAATGPRWRSPSCWSRTCGRSSDRFAEPLVHAGPVRLPAGSMSARCESSACSWHRLSLARRPRLGDVVARVRRWARARRRRRARRAPGRAVSPRSATRRRRPRDASSSGVMPMKSMTASSPIPSAKPRTRSVTGASATTASARAACRERERAFTEWPTTTSGPGAASRARGRSRPSASSTVAGQPPPVPTRRY